MSDLQKFTDLKRRVELARQRADKAQGALEQTVNQLKQEFGCSTLPAAEKKLKMLERQVAVDKEEFDDAVNEFEEKWDGVLNE